jgi:hypothetical protein
VVPTLAPNVTGYALGSDRTPAATSGTRIEVVMLELCTATVMRKPTTRAATPAPLARIPLMAFSIRPDMTAFI